MPAKLRALLHWRRALLVLEALAIAVLGLAVVRLDGLLGRPEERVESRIRAFEQAAFSLRKCLRCAIFVLCFTTAFHRDLLETGAGTQPWPTVVFSHVARELWLLPGKEPAAVAWRRHAYWILMAISKGVLGSTQGIFSHFRETAERPGSTLCSRAGIGWIMLLLDVTANSGFLLGFEAGRCYFAAAVERLGLLRTPKTARDSLFESLSSKRSSRASRWAYSYEGGMRRPVPWTPGKQDAACGGDDGPPQEEEEVAQQPAAEAPAEAPAEANGCPVPTEKDGEPASTPAAAAPSRDASFRSPSREVSFKEHNWEELLRDTGPVFRAYAKIALLGLVVVSLCECYFLQHWEAGVLGARDEEIDVFRYNMPYFVSYTPDFSKWRLKRVVVGSWRDFFYMVFLHPLPCFAAACAAYLVDGLSRRLGWRRPRQVLHQLCLGAASYVVLVSAPRTYFVMICLLICWECRELEIKALGFARAFPQLTTRQRWDWHAELGSEIKALDERLAPLIAYAFLQRLVLFALDLARQSCEVTVPFNLVHYCFRHVMFLGSLALTAWRIGKLNFAFYEKLINTVMDMYPRSWADLGDPGVGWNEVHLQRYHLDDWKHYLVHNTESGRREACVCVLHLRWAAKSHALALSILTLLTLPLLNKLLDTYGRHVVNERLLSSGPAFPIPGEENMCSAAEPGQ